MQYAIIWFRQDLRISDNPAWSHALENGLAIIPVYVWSPETAGEWAPGAASRWWLHHALKDLSWQLEAAGFKLIIRKGRPLEVLSQLLKESEAQAVYWNRCYESFNLREEGTIKKQLKDQGIETWTGNSALLREPWTVATRAGNPFKVYTPYARACRASPDPEPVKTWPGPVGPDRSIHSLELEELQLLPEQSWDEGLARRWIPSREEGLRRMKEFLSDQVGKYDTARDYPGIDGISGLSPYLHWGQIGPREVVYHMSKQAPSSGLKVFHDELLWREFAHHVLYHFPETTNKPLQLKFEKFPWAWDPADIKAWKKGSTGYPIVDAGMRELWETGWMHNRSRMIVGSFLVKHLLHSWAEGARWFWDTLVDADLANNTLGWQWVGGCGADAAPFFRIFNPILQGRKFDQDGAYIKKYVPELKRVPSKYLHAPWEMPEAVQKASGCVIGQDYPNPIVDHREARFRALESFKRIKQAS